MAVPFWSQECPVRGGVGLTHMHSGACRGDRQEHFDDQCCHCGARRSEYDTDGNLLADRHVEVMPPFDMDVRLRSMGLIPQLKNVNEELMAEIQLPPEMREPKLYTGQYADNTKSVTSPGRGPLSDRQKKRLEFVGWRAKDWDDNAH